MRVGEICFFCASTITSILTFLTFSVLWHYHSTIPFNKRNTVTYLSQFLICCITCLVTISVSLVQIRINKKSNSECPSSFGFFCRKKYKVGQKNVKRIFQNIIGSNRRSRNANLIMFVRSLVRFKLI